MVNGILLRQLTSKEHGRIIDHLRQTDPVHSSTKSSASFGSLGDVRQLRIRIKYERRMELIRTDSHTNRKRGRLYFERIYFLPSDSIAFTSLCSIKCPFYIERTILEPV